MYALTAAACGVHGPTQPSPRGYLVTRSAPATARRWAGVRPGDEQKLTSEGLPEQPRGGEGKEGKEDKEEDMDKEEAVEEKRDGGGEGDVGGEGAGEGEGVGPDGRDGEAAAEAAPQNDNVERGGMLGRTQGTGYC